MIEPRKEHLLIKYLSKEVMDLELDVLEDWIKNPENEAILKEFAELNYAIEIEMNNSNPDKIKELLLHEMRSDKNALRNKKLRSVFKYAAIAV
ncbi:MAG: hypothetical protein WA951_10630, partial [Leeuwenhoekiella sp.]